MSAINDLNLYIDIKNRRLVRDIFSDVETVVPKLTQGDGYNLRVHGVQAAPGRPVGRVYDFVPLPDALFVGVGKVGDTNLTGFFTVFFEDEDTDAIPVNATAAQVQTDLNAVPTINADGGVTVSGPAGGPWQVVFNSDGPKDFLTGNADAVFPFSSLRVYRLRAGSLDGAGLREIQLIVIDPQLATLAETFTNLPAASGDVTKLQSGASGVPDIQRVSISRDAYDGGFTLSFDGETTQFIPQDADAEEVKQALDSLSNIGTDGVTVTGAKPNWDVSFTGLAGNQNTMTIDVGGLVVPIGKQGILNLATGGIELLVSNQSSAEAKLEVTGIVDGNHGTILQADCTILNDGIQNDPVAGPTTPTLATQAEVTALEGRVDDVEDALDALDNGVVRFDVAQSLDPSEKEQARDNIGVVSNPLTTAGDIIVGGTSGVQERLAVGASGTILRSNGTAPFYGTDRTNVQVFTANGDWIDPDPTIDRPVEVLLIGGGGGGGSGRTGAAGSNRGGGGGGGGGALVRFETTTSRIRASIVVSGIAVTVGAGGGGGASPVENNFSGVVGSAGGDSTAFGVTAKGGSAGSGGGQSSSVGTGGAAIANSCLIASTVASTLAGGRGGVDSTASAAGGSAVAGRPCGGGGGAGYNDADGVLAESLGGSCGNSTIGQLNVGGQSSLITGAGGDGGAPGSSGGNGFLFGAGGGGGGAGTNDVDSGGAGGAGANGIVIITTLL
jgi:hypothetical protein